MIIMFEISGAEVPPEKIDIVSEVMSEAARSSILGYHRLVVPRAFAKWCVATLDLSKKHKMHIERLGQDYTQLGGQARAAPSKLTIVLENEGASRDGNGGWIIGIGDIWAGRQLERTALILENADNDGAFYEFIFERCSKKLGFGPISFETFNGGGNGSGRELARLSSDCRVIACICDTDMNAPGGAKSPTYNTMMAEYRRVAPLGIASGTPGREVENFLPLHIVESLTENMTAVQKLKELLDLQGEDVDPQDCLWLYFDIKRGFPKGVLEKYCKSEELKNWVAVKYGVEKSKISDIEIPPLGERVLERFLLSEPLKGEMHRYVRTKYWETHFMGWIEMFLWVLAGRKVERAG